MTRGVSAIVLAGGRSSRFGADKLAALVDGRPLLHAAIGACAVVADEVVVVVRAEGPPPTLPGARVPVLLVPDEEPFGGPLAALAAASRHARGPVLLVVGGDMPDLVPSVLRLLVTAVEGGAAAAFLAPPAPTTSQDPAAPVPTLPFACDRAATLAVVDDLLRQDRRSLRALLQSLAAVTLPAATWLVADPRAATLRDVDVPADLVRAPVDSPPRRSSS